MLKLQEKCCIQRSLLSTIYLHTIHPNKRLTFIVSALWCRYYNISSPVKIWAWWGLKLMIRYPFKFVQSPKTLCSVWRDLQVFVLLALTLRKSYIWSNASSLDFASRVETSFSSTTLNLKGFSAAAAPRCATLHMSLRAQRHAKLRPAHHTSISRHIVQRVHKSTKIKPSLKCISLCHCWVITRWWGFRGIVHFNIFKVVYTWLDLQNWSKQLISFDGTCKCQSRNLLWLPQ